MPNYKSSIFVIALILSINMGAVTAPPLTINKKPTPGLSHPRQPNLANPHLHGAKAVVAKNPLKRNVAHHWRGHWAFAYWAALHRGTGMVEGEVRNASGSPMPAMQVVLRGKHGNVLSWNSRHQTTTSQAGIFLMRNVRGGSYRVRASRGKTSGATPIHVHGGQTNLVTVHVRLT